MKLFPFDVAYAAIQADPDPYIDAVFSTLQSSFLIMPRGKGFISYPDFEQAYQALKRHTTNFTVFRPESTLAALSENSLVFIVLRAILGFTPPELAHMTTSIAAVDVSQGLARTIDREIRTDRTSFGTFSESRQQAIRAMLDAACQLITEGAEDVSDDVVHRLNKADTRAGLVSLRHLANEGAPYAMLLYERFLGRPFATHRDSVSELVGEVMESAVEEVLRQARISFRKTKRAEKVEGFDQAPDFIVPDEFNPQIVIEAKITEDDGTARDKVTRIQHLRTISESRRRSGRNGFQVVACIDGRGFGIRREDMRKLLEATQGKVFTLETLDELVQHTRLQGYSSAGT